VLASDVTAPDRPGWLYETPKLTFTTQAAFAIWLVRHDPGADHVAAAAFHYSVIGPVERGERSFVWIGTPWEDLIVDPIENVPVELTAQAREALSAWLAWAEGDEREAR
jgi:hypothetical protein